MNDKNRMENRKQGVCLLVGCLLGIFMVFMPTRRMFLRYFGKGFKHTRATIFWVDVPYHRITVDVSFSFNIDGKVYWGTGTREYPETKKTITVAYNPEDPIQHYIDPPIFFVKYIQEPFCFFFFIISVVGGVVVFFDAVILGRKW